MHEISILYQAAETAARYAEDKGIDSVLNIRIDIGELSGALPQVFTNYFPIIAGEYPRLKGANLELHTIPGEALCTQCGSMYNVMKQEGVCPCCKSHEKTVLGGQEIKLMSIGF